MHQVRLLILLIFIPALGSAAPGQHSSGFTTEAQELQETRGWNVSSDPVSVNGRSVCHVAVRVHGNVLSGATAYANLRIDVAEDNTGASLVNDDWGLRQNSQLHLFRPEEVVDGDDPSVILDFVITPPSRRATRIVHVSGSVQIRAGGNGVNTVRLPKISQLFSSTVSDATLNAHHLRLEPNGAPREDGNGVLSCNFSGNLGAIRRLRAIDGNGVPLGESDLAHAIRYADGCAMIVEMSKPLDDRTAIEIDLVRDQKVVDVPFTLRDIRLP